MSLLRYLNNPFALFVFSAVFKWCCFARKFLPGCVFVRPYLATKCPEITFGHIPGIFASSPFFRPNCVYSSTYFTHFSSVQNLHPLPQQYFSCINVLLRVYFASNFSKLHCLPHSFTLALHNNDSRIVLRKHIFCI